MPAAGKIFVVFQNASSSYRPVQKLIDTGREVVITVFGERRAHNSVQLAPL